MLCLNQSSASLQATLVCFLVCAFTASLLISRLLFYCCCQVVDVSTSKTGKHGHAKCNFTAVDIFTGKKYEDMMPSSHNCDVSSWSATAIILQTLLLLCCVLPYMRQNQQHCCRVSQAVCPFALRQCILWMAAPALCKVTR
jgi:hypothetical protein